MVEEGSGDHMSISMEMCVSLIHNTCTQQLISGSRGTFIFSSTFYHQCVASITKSLEC